MRKTQCHTSLESFSSVLWVPVDYRAKGCDEIFIILVQSNLAIHFGDITRQCYLVKSETQESGVQIWLKFGAYHQSFIQRLSIAGFCRSVKDYSELCCCRVFLEYTVVRQVISFTRWLSNFVCWNFLGDLSPFLMKAEFLYESSVFLM